MVYGSFLVRCEAVGPGVRPLISAWILFLSTVPGIWDFFLHESSHEALKWLPVFLFAIEKI
jgi:hypothetical protein